MGSIGPIGFRVYMVQGLGLGVRGLGFRVQGLGAGIRAIPQRG